MAALLQLRINGQKRNDSLPLNEKLIPVDDSDTFRLAGENTVCLFNDFID